MSGDWSSDVCSSDLFPSHDRSVTNIYMYKIKKAIKFAYEISTSERHKLTMPDNKKIKLTSFALKNIDDERTTILAAPSTSAYELSRDRLPYSAAIETIDLPSYDRKKTYQSSTAWYSQAGLALKTYQSDLFNNWLSTEDIDQITTQTSIDMSGPITIDQINIKKNL